MNALAKRLFAADPTVLYVATNIHGKLELNEREGLSSASASESERYEELLVNPTLLTLLSRGELEITITQLHSRNGADIGHGGLVVIHAHGVHSLFRH
jgi:hypothetical protein